MPCYDAQLLEKKNESRRAEWLAVRLLVKELFGSECEVAYHPTGRPYLKHGTAHISISHTKGFAAVAYHRCAQRTCPPDVPSYQLVGQRNTLQTV